MLPGSAVDVYHLNESHAGFGILPLLQKMEAGEVRKRVCFTTHTPVPAGHQKFDMNLVEPELGYLAKYIPGDLVTDGILEMTELCLRYSEFANGVSQKHKYVSQNMFPEFPIEYVTNGIHHLTWLSDHLAEIFDAKLPGWRQNPEHLRMARNLPSEEILQAHAKAKKDMTNFLNQRYHVELSDKVFTIGFARRAAYYKRANLIFQDKKRLEDIAGKFGGIQLIFSGKAHPADTLGQEFIREISELAKTTAESLKVVYIPDYGMELSKHLVGGVDVWLNNPIVPMEASGTSGMKASLNGIPNISTLDGWWLEGWVENVTGWAIGAGCEGEICEPKEVEDLYGILENTVLPTYHGDSQAWANIQKHCIAENGSFFTTHRMLQEYLVKGYLGGW